MSRTFSSCVRDRSENGIGAADEIVELGDLDLLVGHDRDDLLREDVERVARDLRLLDLAVPHRAGDDRRLEQVGAELREDPPLRDGVQLVAGPADALQPARDRLRRLDLDHEVDGAHVDPELERGRRDEAGDPAGLQILLDEDALLAGEAAVMGPGDLALGELVEAQREPLGEPAVVDEDDRRAVRLDELEELGIHRRPDRGDRVLRAAVGDLAFGRGAGERARRSSRARGDPRPGRRPAGRAPCASRRRRARSAGRPRRTARSPRAAAASPRARSAGSGARRAAGAARPRARDGRRASCRRPRAPRRGSASRRPGGSRGRPR